MRTHHVIAKALAILALLAAGTQMATAQTVHNNLSAAISGPLDSRVKVFAYSPDIVFTLNIAVGMHTHIALGDDEVLTEKPRLGDTLQWRVGGNTKNIYVKALKLGISTSMTLVTSKRAYQFELIATDQPLARTQKAYFNYPEVEEAIQLEVTRAEASDKSRREHQLSEAARLKAEELASPLDPSRLNFSYLPPVGDPELRPTAVFDDGVFTYLRLPPSQDLPVVFMADQDNKLTPINYEVRRDEIKIERLAKKWVLRLGKREVVIERKGS